MKPTAEFITHWQQLSLSHPWPCAAAGDAVLKGGRADFDRIYPINSLNPKRTFCDARHFG
jgi:hypothetical protein